MRDMLNQVEANVTFLPPERGGRNSAVPSGYIPNIHYADGIAGGVLTFPDVNHVQPGESARVLFRLINPAAHTGKIRPGMEIELREGPFVVGVGKVTRVWPPLY